MLELIDPVLVWKNSPKWLKGASIAFMVIGVNPMVGLPGAVLYEGISYSEIKLMISKHSSD